MANNFSFRAMFGRVLRAERRSHAARTVELFGWLILIEGAIILFAPNFVASVLHLPALTEQAANYFRLAGVLVGGLGMLYVVSGRLGAEGFFTLVGDSGDPTSNSAAAYYAIGCADTVEPFDWSVPTFARIDQYNDAVADKPPSYYAPFSGSAANDFLFSGNGRQCFWWQRPTPPSPTVPPNTTFPDTPTLVLDGDIDNRVPYEETNEVAELFPNSTNVIIPEAGHETIGWSQCALNLANQFIENLQAGDTSCANTPAAIFPAVGRFPLMVEDARPAQPDTSGANQIGIAERKTVSVAVATAIDALQRSLISFGSGSGVGLRGGTFTTAINGAVWTVTLTNCAFATDVIVNGTFVWGADNSIIGVLMISGPGTAGGTLHINGFFDIPGPVGNLSLTGMLGGKQVAVLVPNA